MNSVQSELEKAGLVVKAKRVLVIADSEHHMEEARKVLQDSGFEVVAQLCNDLDHCSCCGKPKKDCLCRYCDLLEYVHDTGLAP